MSESLASLAHIERPWNPQRVDLVQLSSGQQLLNLDGIHGFLLPGEINFIYELMRSLPPGGRYLEIGSFMGLSAAIAATALRELGNNSARLFCIDTWKGSMEHQGLEVIRKGALYDIFKQNIRRSRAERMITACRGESTKVVDEFLDQSLDIIFIDGDHTYDGARKDMELWFPKLKTGGRFLGHDAIPIENPTCGVRRAITDFCSARGYTYTLVEPPQAHFVWELRY